MSNPVPASLPAGPYVIRNRYNSAVVHIQHADATHQGIYSVQAYQQDEGQFKDQQIWWIEPLADFDTDSAKGVVYSISSPGSGKLLEGNPQSGWAYSNKNCGGAWQRWRLRKVTDQTTNEVSYNIFNALNDKVLDIHGPNPQPGAWVHLQPYAPDRSQNCWEFTIPVVGFPPGWFHVQNVGTGQLLSHDYVHNPPALLVPPDALVESQHREQWQYQWTLCHSKCFKPGTAGERNSWYIINRLTGAPLSPHLGNMKESDFAGRDDNLAWKLELDSVCNWKITNRTTSCLLQQGSSPIADVHCSDRRFTQAGGRQSWILRPPLCHPGDDTPPPEYGSAES